MKTHLLIGLRLTLVSMIFFGVIYPLVITGIAKLLPSHGEGQTIEVNGKVVGFEVIGQSFSSEKYFNSRPSAVNYNAASTGGSNKGPTNPEYLQQVEQRITDFLKQNPAVKREDVPVDLVTASGGGLDPHISVQAAMVQIPRIAKARGVSKEALEKLVKQHSVHPFFGLAPATVHVLKLNIALDELK
jgi:K+-transporting ATPase ATPase C chain